jgi:hypothetical protein
MVTGYVILDKGQPRPVEIPATTRVELAGLLLPAMTFKRTWDVS